MTASLSAELFNVVVTPKYNYGFVIKFTTWENDGDDYSTQTITGIKTRADVDFWIELASRFSSTNSRSSGMGNEEHDHQTLVALVQEVLANHPNVSQDIVTDFEAQFDDESEGELHQYLYECMLGDPIGYEFMFCRVVEKVQVQLIQPMVVDIETRRV